jgi:cysteine desulfurase/selenocysteine lyase
MGGRTIGEVTQSGYKLTEPPVRFEAGTRSIAEAIGLREAVGCLAKVDLDPITKREQMLIENMYGGLTSIDGVEVYGPSNVDQKTGILAFNIEGLNPHDVTSILDNSANIVIRSGHHCAILLHTELLSKPGELLEHPYTSIILGKKSRN